MKKYFIHSQNNNIKEYTLQLIKYQADKSLYAEIVDKPQEADYILVSICDITEAHEIINARAYNKPIITGGMLSEVPIINELSDYVWHGEIYGFFDLMGKYKPADIEYITTKVKKKLVINKDIKWNENPIVKVGSKSAYYYVSKGCPIKCKYCYIGAIRDYVKIDESLYRRAEKTINRAKKRMMPIAAYNPYPNKTTRAITEVLLKHYIRHPNDYGNIRMIRTGYEFMNEKLSKNLAKGVMISDFNEFIKLSKYKKSKSIVYFIAGLEGTEEIKENILNILPDYETMPVITINYTYLQPQNYTAFYDYDISRRIEIDVEKIFREVNGINKRIRVNPLAPIVKSTIRTFMERTVKEDEFVRLQTLLSKYKKINNDQIMDKFNHLVGTASLDDIMKRKRGKYNTYINYWE